MSKSMSTLRVALAQIAPAWLNKEKTLDKIIRSLKDAGKQKCELIVFGEALLPGYPFWIALTNGAEWNSALQNGLGEDLHIAVWPGSAHNTADITRFISLESRSFVISVSGLMRKEDFPRDTPHLARILENAPDILTNGGSCIAGPDGNWIVEPVINKEGLIIETLDFNKVLEERQNFDPAGHYSRPDVTRLSVNRQRQSIIDLVNE